MQAVAPPPAARYCPAERHSIRPPATSLKPGDEPWPVSSTAIPPKSTPHPRNAGQEPQRQYFPDDVAFAGLFPAILPARRRDPHRANSILSCANLRSPAPASCARRRTRSGAQAHRQGCRRHDEQNAALENWQATTCSTRCSAPRSPSPTRSSNCAARPMRRLTHRGKTDAGRAGRVAAPGRLLHHDLKIPGNVQIDMQPVTEVV